MAHKKFLMEISQIKAQLKLESVLNHYGLSPDRSQRLNCPWHPDKTPSLQIYPKTNTWTCFSSNCEAGTGDQIDFIMKLEKITKHEAINKAKTLLGETIIEKTEAKKQLNYTKLYDQLKEKYTASVLAKKYVHERGLDDELLAMAYNPGTEWKQMKQCLIFPLRNEQGQITSFYGRSIKNEKNARHYYSASRIGLYPSWPAVNTKQLIITESVIDASTLLSTGASTLLSTGAATLEQLGYSTLALYGTNGWTEEHTEAISKLNELEEIILFLDGDEAGKAATQSYFFQLKEEHPELLIRKVKTDEGEDVNSLLVKYGAEYIEEILSEKKESKSTNKEKAKNKLLIHSAELIEYKTEILHITILGGIKINGLDRLRVTLKITNESDKMALRHSLDLYNHKHLSEWVERIADHFDLQRQQVHNQLGQMITELETYRWEKIEALKPKEKEKEKLSPAEEKAAIKYLKNPSLIKNTMNDLEQSGIVGEKENALIAYLAYTSRKREKPLHIMFLGSSASGKTYLQEQIGRFIPDDEKEEITSLSDNALYYYGRKELKNKLILIEDLDGAENVLYPLRELQSKRKISKTVTVKDSKGHLKTVTLIVEGPVCVSGCTTRERIYEDNANRCLLLYVDQSGQQDQRVMNYQKAQSSGRINEGEERAAVNRLRRAQQQLKNVKIINRYADQIELPRSVL